MNDAPVAQDDTATTAEDEGLEGIDVLANDSDVEGDALTITSASATNGTVEIVDNKLNYTPDPNFNGSETISYTADDGNGGQSNGSVALEVTSVADAPVANDDTASVDEDQTLTSIDPLANDTDVEGQELTIQSASAQNGTVTVNNDQTLAYTPDADFFGIDAISYTILDEDGLTSTANIEIEVASLNDAPDAVADEADFKVGQSVLIDVLANDTDADGDALSLVPDSLTFTDGEATITDDDMIEFTATGENPTLSYIVTDGEANREGLVNFNLQDDTQPTEPEEEDPSSSDDGGGFGEIFMGILLLGGLAALAMGGGMGGLASLGL